MDEKAAGDRKNSADLEAERAVLGGAMLSSDVACVVTTYMTAEDFSTLTHKHLFSIMAALASADSAINALTVESMIENWNWHEPESGPEIIAQMMTVAQHRPDTREQMRIVQDHAMVRLGIPLPRKAVAKPFVDPDVVEHCRPSVIERGFEWGTEIRAIADVKCSSVQWLWPERIPRGKVTVIAGDPGLGKSFLTIDIAARTSIGRHWPDHSEGVEPGSVLMLNAEDDEADTMRPRLEAAGADWSKTFFVDHVKDVDPDLKIQRQRDFSLAVDLPGLEGWLSSTKDARLITIDPISAYWTGPDSRHTVETPWIMAGLNNLAREYQVAIVVVTHLRRGCGGKAMYRALGNMSIVTTARSAWMVSRDLERSERRLLLPAKTNLCPHVNGLAYQIEQGKITWDANPVVETADDYLRREFQTSRESLTASSSRIEVTAWLRQALENGPRPVRELLDEARELGHSERTIRRVQRQLGCKTERPIGTKTWIWSIGDAALDTTCSKAAN